MAKFDERLAARIDDYIDGLFIRPDPVLAANLANAEAAGLPPINVTANQGQFLYLLAKMAGAKRILEIGTLGAYSTTWMARALPPDGRLVSLEFSPKHAACARQNLEAAGQSGVVEIRVGDAAAALDGLVLSGEPAFDFVFIDADKKSYMNYLELVLKLVKSGSVIVADNVIRNGAVLDENPTDLDDAGARDYNAAVAANPQLESMALPMFKDKIDGMTISRVL